ncbi:MAG: Transamidase GatB domain protein [uncultured Paraburkholderia sp.]|nr:MAG: Transamidase GatB domain protein [uncultured Paraburkholderia sp.]CAH2937344.1 MAG: Transamidase GatB domain protein [uncultured Paraburkholderia sp.]
MIIKGQINDDMKAAMRAREAKRLGTIRLLLAAIKQRKDSISQFETAGRTELADKEKAELAILSAYMPAQMFEAEIVAEVQAAVAQTGAAGPQDMGKVMGVLKPKLAGRADMTAVSAQVKAALAK